MFGGSPYSTPIHISLLRIIFFALAQLHSDVDPILVHPSLLIGGVPGFSGNSDHFRRAPPPPYEVD